MNRRKALIGIALFSGAAYVGYKVYDLLAERNVNLEEQKGLIAELAESILPRTDTPGAKEAKVEEAIIVFLKDCTDRKTLNNFLDGLEEVDSYAQSQFQQAFVRCDSQQRTYILSYFEKKGKLSAGFIGKVQKKLFGQPFFATLKEYTVRGYCTSMAGANQGLSYLYIPSKRLSCMDMMPHQKSWATQ
jgi:hypothetical protein